MKIDVAQTDEVILGELGRRLARIRLDRNIPQAELATEAGVSKSTVERLEAGRPVRTPSVVRVMRALGLLHALDRLIPELRPSPLARLEAQGKVRQRARGGRRPGRFDDESVQEAPRPPSEEGPAGWGMH